MMQSVLALRAPLERKNQDHLHILREERRKRRTQLTHQRESKKIIYCLEVPEMLKSSPMLGSMYSHIKELLRNTLSEYRL